ncbi:MAG: SGNH/GDSL hydrolase family protein [Lentisphaerae bacterium]|nr:SGNH/GDSL hydrolase family protein [Lentisphaerota bacterium]
MSQVRQAARGETWFGLASLLHARLGRDVVTFGASGAGSLRGMAGEPLVGLAVINATAGLRMAPPATVVVMFYEGNDLNDNLVDVMQRYKPSYDLDRLQDPDYFRAFIDEEVVAKDPLNPRTHPRAWWRHSLLLSFLVAQFGEPEESVLPPRAPAFWQQDSNHVVVGGREVSIPGHLQGPALELSDGEMALGGYVFERALAYLRAAWPEARFVVLYVPSVLTCYQPAAATVSTESYHFRGAIYPAARVASRSGAIYAEVARACAAQGVPLIDSRARLQAVAARELIHGPGDWFHLNRHGYEELGAVLVGGMGAGP